jgi:CheY-like chemotaxis protein
MDSSDDTVLYVDSVEIAEYSPQVLSESQFEAAVLRSFLNVFNNQLYVVIQNSGDALKKMNCDSAGYSQLQGIARAADELESAAKRLQRLVEGAQDFGGSETILVADDQEPVRNLVVKTLEQYGYRVFGVSSGLDAMERCKAYPGVIHLLLADVGMEPMDGYELAKRFLRAKPTAKVIYMSGNLPDHTRALPGTEFLSKPDQLVDGLARKVWQALNRP